MHITSYAAGIQLTISVLRGTGPVQMADAVVFRDGTTMRTTLLWDEQSKRFLNLEEVYETESAIEHINAEFYEARHPGFGQSHWINLRNG